MIIVWPTSGKTTLAKKLSAKYGVPHLSTDPERFCFAGEQGIPDSLDWSGGSQYVADHFFGRPAIIEGCALPRALRKWLKAHPGHAIPVDKIIWLTAKRGPHKQGQISQGKGIETVIDEIWPHISHLVHKCEVYDG